MMLKNKERKVEKEYGITRKKIQLAFPDNGDMQKMKKIKSKSLTHSDHQRKAVHYVVCLCINKREFVTRPLMTSHHISQQGHVQR